MEYVYDILVNFNDELYEFFEWDKDDNIEHIRKIPMFKINTNAFLDFKNNIIKLDKVFLDKIKNKTEIFTNTNVGVIEYSAIFTDGMDLVVIEFDSEGVGYLKSSMLLDEYEDTLDESELLDVYDINYEIILNNKVNRFETRYQNKVLEYIKDEINLLIKYKNYNKLKYLYYEWYNKRENDIENVIQKLSCLQEEEFSKKHIKFYELIRLSNKDKQI